MGPLDSHDDKVTGPELIRFTHTTEHHAPLAIKLDLGALEIEGKFIGFLRWGCPRGGSNWGTLRIPFGKIGEP